MAKIIVTGANGFIGGHIIRRLKKNNHSVLALSRSRPDFISENEFLTWSLGHKLSSDSLSGASTLIHCAWDLNEKQNMNVGGSLQIFEEARRSGIENIIFLSSFSARPEALSQYGKEKLAVEKALGMHGCSLRPGLVIGQGGIFLNMVKMVKTLPILPVIDGGDVPVPVVSINHLLDVIAQLSDNPKKGSFNVYSQHPPTLKEILNAIATSTGKGPLLVPLPWRAAWIGASIVEGVGMKSPISKESLLGFKANKITESDLKIEAWANETRSLSEMLKGM